MLYRLINSEDSWIRLISDDPVRPEILPEFRVSASSDMFVLLSEGQARAAVCVAYRNLIPSSMEQLVNSGPGVVAVFYTIWSYSSGAGRELLQSVRSWLENNKPEISTFVTFSPKTDLARKFHLANGAEEFRVNDSAVNYLYR